MNWLRLTLTNGEPVAVNTATIAYVRPALGDDDVPYSMLHFIDSVSLAVAVPLDDLVDLL